MKILKLFSFGLVAVLAAVLVAASVVEHVSDAQTARTWLYTSPLTLLLWGVAAAASLVLVVRKVRPRQWATLLLHAAFAVILCGALATHLWGEKGRLELVAGGKGFDAFMREDGRVSHFPFSVRLVECRTDYYPGTRAGMDYVSRVELTDPDGTRRTAQISMNRILTHRKYRFYQTAMGEDRTVLTVSHDPWGIGITYAGYALLLAAMAGFFFQRGSRYRALLRGGTWRGAAMCILLACGAAAQAAEADTPRTLQRGLAKNFGRLYVCYNDRICPVQTLARDFCTKLYGRSSYRGLTAEQVLTGWIFYYDDWKDEPMIRIKDEETRRLLGIGGKYARLTDFYAPQGYKLAGATADLGRRGVQEADEKCRLASLVCTGAALKIYPCRTAVGADGLAWLSWVDDMPHGLAQADWQFVRRSMEYVAQQIEHGHNIEANEALTRIRAFQEERAGSDVLPSPTRFEAELLYNTLGGTRPMAIACTALGLLAYALCCRRMAQGRPTGRRLRLALTALLGLLLVYLTAAIALRGYVAGHLPLSNGFETMQLMAWCTVCAALVLRRKASLVLPGGLLLCGLSLLVAMMGESNPQITPLMPVLASPLLSLHVVVIMVAYALLALTALNSLTALVLRGGDTPARFLALNRLLLCPALFLLAAGIFTGAVWANQSWGAYWSWDPKETWALITLLVYAFPLHDGTLPAFRRPAFFHLYVFLAFASVLMTYFGVNFLLGGMHSYA